MTRTAFSLFLVSALVTPAAVASPDDPAAILAQSRAALALDHRPAAGIQATGRADFIGTDAAFTLLSDNHGSFVARIDGPLSFVNAFDGTSAWERDWNNTQRTLPLGDRDDILLSYWAITGDWAAAKSPLHFTMAAADAAAPADAISLAFTLDHSPLAGTVQIARDTHLPRRFDWKAGSESSSVELSGFQPVGGFTLPTGIVQTGRQGEAIRMTITGAASAPTFIRSPYQPLPAAPADTAFNNALPADLEVKRAPTGHLLVHPLIGGKDLGWFIFDTGAGSNVLSTPVAKEAGFESFGLIKALGVGGTTNATFYRAPDLSLGRVTIDKPIFVGIDLAFLDQYMGVRVGGVLGYELLARCTVEFGLTDARIALHDPKSFDHTGLTWQDLIIYERHPCTKARFEDHEGIFKLDTGAAQDTVTFHAPAVQSLHLLDGRATTDTTMGGVGGNVTGKSGTLAWFELGPKRTENLTTNFATQPVGAFADPYTAGNIGGQLMAPFTLVLDYQNSRIAFVPKP